MKKKTGTTTNHSSARTTHAMLAAFVGTLLVAGPSFGGSLSVPHDFVAGEKALASEVNQNFTAVENAVNDNDSRITTSSGAIATNAAAIAASQNDIAANAADTATNAGDIAANAAGIAANTSAIGSLSATVAAQKQAAIKPGITPYWVQIQGSTSDLLTTAATAPGNGVFLVMAVGTVIYQSNGSGVGNICLDVSEISGNVGGCAPSGANHSATRFQVPASAGTALGVPYTVVDTVAVSQGETRTFYLAGYYTGTALSSTDSVYLFQPTLNIVYLPGSM